MPLANTSSSRAATALSSRAAPNAAPRSPGSAWPPADRRITSAAYPGALAGRAT